MACTPRPRTTSNTGEGLRKRYKINFGSRTERKLCKLYPTQLNGVYAGWTRYTYPQCCQAGLLPGEFSPWLVYVFTWLSEVNFCLFHLNPSKLWRGQATNICSFILDLVTFRIPSWGQKRSSGKEPLLKALLRKEYFALPYPVRFISSLPSTSEQIVLRADVVLIVVQHNSVVLGIRLQYMYVQFYGREAVVRQYRGFVSLWGLATAV